MTKEEILRDCLNKLSPEYVKYISKAEQDRWNYTIEAMEQYAQQQCQEQLREELIKLVQIARKGSMVTSGITGYTYWKFDIDSEKKVIDEYLKQKELPL
jgi:hypothetical protein